MIRWIWAFIDRPLDRFEQAGTFWTTVTGSRLSPLRGSDHEFATLLPRSGEAALKLQGVHDQGGAHLDLEVDDVPAAIEAAGRLGATVVASKPVSSVMRSPGGQQFCVEPWDGAVSRPAVFVQPDGTSSRLDQVCLDIAPALYEVEKEFWTAFTGWKLHASARPEFNLLKPGPGLPIRILLQRLGSDRASSAHVDLACSDIEATSVWHEQLGAREVGRGPHWIVMEDPTAGTYCLTSRDPQANRPPGAARSEADPVHATFVIDSHDTSGPPDEDTCPAPLGVAEPFRLRWSVRALIVDELERVLLCRFDLPTQGVVVWAAPGGGVEPGETPFEALVRELDEEVGLALRTEPPLVWHQRIVAAGHAEGYDGVVNDYHLVRVNSFVPAGSMGAELLLSENVTGFRWWALDELDAYRGEDIFAPRDLAALTTQLLRDGIPQAPLALGL